MAKPALAQAADPAVTADHATAVHGALGHGLGGQPFSGMMIHLGKSATELWTAIKAMLADASRVPNLTHQAASLLTDDGELGSVPFVLACLAGMVLTALIAAALVHRLLRPERRRLAHMVVDRAAKGILLGLEGLLVDLLPPAAYLLACSLLYNFLFTAHGLIFVGTDVFQGFANAFVQSSTIGWAAYVILSQPFAADRPNLRLVPLDDVAARQARRVLARIIATAMVPWIVAEGLFYLWFGDGLPHLIIITASFVVGLMCLRALYGLRPHLNGFARYWHSLAVLSVFGLGATWILGVLLLPMPPFDRVLGTLIVLAAMPAFDSMVALALRQVKERLLRRHAEARLIFVPGDEGEPLQPVAQPAEGPQETTEQLRAIDAFTEVLHYAASWVFLLAAGAFLARLWSLDVIRMLGARDARTMLGVLFDAGVTLLIGWYVWRLFETGLTVALSREASGPGSRASTVQPLLRSIGMIVIAAVALMWALSVLGLNIAPLLASAGVVGIAIGFGAQTLVKDLFSGAFFLIEDVFRIGDYIEAGTAKGTVEKITFRTVALRHQNGPLHFVPYGSLGSVRNNSRDWVIDKFEIPLPTEVDSETVRRIVKRIGIEMLEHDELAQHIMAPLKAKLYRIQPGAKIFRCKVQTPPGKQFEIRTEAYRRIEQAFAEANIPFASNISSSVIVHAGHPPAQDDAPLHAVEDIRAAE
ncbi:MAG TPA: mechanosensitive ion channel domain-containing protein [Aliidongia sp.]|uniref:mechanosensitive ion channel family protein n=1 Tax=Aliidongia sp. TaxID=1914230 RepID=UPI002DDD11E9|nr:mechanosensitive ion channel domain-containing protein [Aliidongia sp.]HEV2676774.1 mechanosensitive ion channel domain-containing protein [Aliidongia sp.]